MERSEGVRIEETLHIKIGEAKNLPNSAVNHESFCTVSFDREKIFTTATISKSPNPFYGEEFQCEIPRKFRFLTFYVCEKANKQDKVVGKVTLKKEDLRKYQGKDHWFPLQVVDAHSEVQGKVHLEVELTGCPNNNNSKQSSHITVKVLECCDLSVISGACNPYAIVGITRVRANKTKLEVKPKKTTVKKKTTNPCFNETFSFDLEKKNPEHEGHTVTDYVLSVSLWHDDSRISREGSFLGEVRIPLGDLEPSRVHKAWHFLQPKGSSQRASSLGTLRLKITYAADHVFSSAHYSCLLSLLLESPTAQPISSSIAYILGEVVDNKEEAARPLVRVFYKRGQVVQLIAALADWEIVRTADANTLFRGNTLVTKLVDELMKLVGLHYLQDTVKDIIDDIFQEKKPCEIDPKKLREGENLEQNMSNLEAYVERIFKAILYSGLNCPNIMCEVFSALKDAATKHFPSKKEVRYQVLSGFVFLRFFAPAILGPKLFQLRTEMPDLDTHRTLTLISKTIQSLGNIVCAKTLTYGFKEDYMIPLFQKLTSAKHVEDIKTFLDIISSLTRMTLTTIDAPVVLKEGFLIKRAQGRRRLGLKNFKRRYFSLTNHSLIYSKKKGSPALCEIPIHDILAVEDLQDSSFTRQHMFQVVQPDRALYIQASNCVEEKEWKHILNKVCNMNKNRLKVFHPGAYLKGHWLCCKSSDQSGQGCSPVTGGLPADIKIEVDEDREMEKIHFLFVSCEEKLRHLQDVCKDRSEDGCEAQSDRGSGDSSTVIEDPQSCSRSLQELMGCVGSLEQIHLAYQQLLKQQMVLGSEEFPLGDEGYARTHQIR